MAPHRNTATILAHTIFILMLLVLPELVMAIAIPHRSHWGFYPGFYVKVAVFLCVFYINYFWLVDRQLGQQRPSVWRFVGLNAVLIAVALTVNYAISAALFEFPGTRRFQPLTDMQRYARYASFALRDAVMMVLSIGLAAAMRLSTRWGDIQLQRQKLLSAQRQSELENLKSQLNPHFLFNTLNSIYALIDLNGNDAKEAVHRLSGMLRYMLYENSPKVPLPRETEFVANYVSLMQLRLRISDHPLEVSLPDDGQTRNMTVPPLIFIPLVENALKYGLSGAPGTPVRITMTAGPSAIEFTTENGYEHTSSKKGRGGIGLTNLRRRLVLIYGGSATLSTTMSGDIFTSHLILPTTVPDMPLSTNDNKHSAK